jgi:ribosomal protein S18 acetylase RimI-like enzyme
VAFGKNQTDRLKLAAENPMTRPGDLSRNAWLQPLRIRRATGKDREAIWQIFHAVVSGGDTYVFDPDISRRQALAYWFSPKTRCYVALSNQKIVGTYIMKANQPGLGSHVANAGFMVAPSAQGRGIGRAMGEHCLREAERLGFRAMQFNFVVSTNETAVRLWKDLGFKIVGRLPGAFRHAQDGFVDVYVMYRPLILA